MYKRLPRPMTICSELGNLMKDILKISFWSSSNHDGHQDSKGAQLEFKTYFSASTAMVNKTLINIIHTYIHIQWPDPKLEWLLLWDINRNIF